MTELIIKDQHYPCQPDETVLDALLRQEVDVPYGCRQGSCQACMVRSLDVTPPGSAQHGLRDTLITQGYFLACCCVPETDMTLRLPHHEEHFSEGIVKVHEQLNRNTLMLKIECKNIKDYIAGQFVKLRREDGLTRSYSIADISDQVKTLEFHIRRLPGGQFSEWVNDELEVGHVISISEPLGNCFYLPDRKHQNMLLVGTGTGLAPLMGIIKDALSHDHEGDIYLFHGCREHEDLYKVEEMRHLQNEYPNFHYTPCISSGHVPEGYTKGRANEVALETVTDLKGWRVFLCGHPDMVSKMKIDAFIKGAASTDIYTDAFSLTADS